MKILTCEITVGKYTFNAVTDVTINLSNSNFVNTCNITLPSSAVIANTSEQGQYIKTGSTIKRGDAVTVKLGYNGNNKTEFTGFVDRVNEGDKTVLNCEDNAFLLRKQIIKKSYRSVKLKQLLNDVVGTSGVKVSPDIPDLNIVKVSLNDTDGLTVLNELKKTYGLQSYINRKGELYSGLAYTETYNTVKLKTDVNVIDNKSLTVINANESKYKIKVVYFKPDGTKLEKEVGEDGGEMRTIFLYNIDDNQSLTDIANNELKRYQSQKLSGSIKTFIQPEIYNGDTVNYDDVNYPSRNGNFYVDTVTVNFNTSGARRQIEIGINL